jgi:hypothetical protein
MGLFWIIESLGVFIKMQDLQLRNAKVYGNSRTKFTKASLVEKNKRRGKKMAYKAPESIKDLIHSVGQHFLPAKDNV